MANTATNPSEISDQKLSPTSLLVSVAEQCQSSLSAHLVDAGCGLRFLAAMLDDHAIHANRIITLSNDEIEGISCAMKAIALGLILEGCSTEESAAEALRTYRGEVQQ